jgi:hypothetical protein
MRNKFFRFNSFLLCACFALSTAHAMEEMGSKRFREDEELPDSKKLKTILAKHPAEIPTNSDPYSTPNFTIQLLRDIFGTHIAPHLSGYGKYTFHLMPKNPTEEDLKQLKPEDVGFFYKDDGLYCKTYGSEAEEIEFPGYDMSDKKEERLAKLWEPFAKQQDWQEETAFLFFNEKLSPETLLMHTSLYRYLPYEKNKKIWELRLVSKAWCGAVNFHITKLDLSEFYRWVPWERKREITTSKGKLGIYWNILEEAYPNSRVIKPELKDLEVMYDEGKIFLSGTDRCLTCESSGETLWTSDRLVFKGPGAESVETHNPLLVRFSDISLNLEQFPNLNTLKLQDNTGITDELLKKATNLTHLDLKRNRVITHESVRCLTNLKTLSLISFESPVKIEELGPLTNLQILKAYWFQKNVSESLKLPRLQVLSLCNDGRSYYEDDSLLEYEMGVVKVLLSLMNEEQHGDKLAGFQAEYDRIKCIMADPNRTPLNENNIAMPHFQNPRDALMYFMKARDEPRRAIGREINELQAKLVEFIKTIRTLPEIEWKD